MNSTVSSNPPTDSNASLRTAPSPVQNVVAGPGAFWWTWWWSRFRNPDTTPGLKVNRRTSRRVPSTPVRSKRREFAAIASRSDFYVCVHEEQHASARAARTEVAGGGAFT